MLIVEGIQRSFGMSVYAHDEVCVDLDLLKLLAVGAVSVQAKLVTKHCETVDQHLAFLVTLREEGWGIVGTAVWSASGWAIRHGNVVCGHG